MAENHPAYLKWSVPEYRPPQRGRSWYLAAGAFVLVCLFFSFFAFEGWRPVFLGLRSNFLFALIIIIASAVTLIHENQEPLMVKVELGPEGIQVGETFYDYDIIKHFAVIYKPKQSIKNLYLEFKNSFRPRLSLPLRSLDALAVRNFLAQYLDEDLDRTDPPLSEQLTKVLKL